MNKTELISQVAEKTGLTKKDTTATVETLFEVITDALVTKGEKISILGFGNFEVKNRAARVGRNPQTGETVPIPASRTPSWKPSEKLKEKFKQ